MKIIVFDWENSDITVNPLTDEEENALLTNGDDYASVILESKGYNVNNYSLNWMIVDPDLPVYNYGDNIPFIAL